MSFTALKTSLRKFPILFSFLKFVKQAGLKCYSQLEALLILLDAWILSTHYGKLSCTPGKRENPHLLLLTDFNLPAGYDCDTAYEVWGISLEEAENATFTRLTFPKHLPGKLRFIRQLFSTCRQEKPDFIFLALGGDPAIFPPPSFWNLLGKTCPIPLFALLADSLPYFITYLEKIHCLSGVVSIDASEPCRNSSRLAAKAIFLPCPVCTSIFYDQPGPRNKLVSFMGLTVNHYAYRAEAVAAIRKADIPIYTGGGYQQRVSLLEMANIYRDSRFVINFSGKPDRITQCKARVIEATLCGACLIEYNNPETNHWLQPDRDYVAYDTVAEIPAKIQFLLAHPEQLEQIRQSGTRRAQQLFGARKVWTQILAFAEQQRGTPPVTGSNVSSPPAHKSPSPFNTED